MALVSALTPLSPVDLASCAASALASRNALYLQQQQQHTHHAVWPECGALSTDQIWRSRAHGNLRMVCVWWLSALALGVQQLPEVSLACTRHALSECV